MGRGAVSGAQVTSCGHGPAIDLPPHVWQCRFLLPAGTASTRASIMWTHEGDATINAAADMTSAHRLDGTSTPVSPGAFLTISEEPVLFRYGG
jgi:hypothetical protein